MLQPRLLTIEELRKFHTQPTTDFAFLLGAWQTESPKVKYQISPPNFFDPDRNLVDSPRFSSTFYKDCLVRSFGGAEFRAFPHEEDMSCPVALEKGSISKENVLILSSRKRLIDENDPKGLSFVLGAYPQTVADKEKAEILEKRYQKKDLTKTGNGYTYFVHNTKERSSGHLYVKKCFEYELGQERYVRFVPQGLHFLHQFFELSNGEKIVDGKPEWVKVEGLRWNIPFLNGPRTDAFLNQTAYLQVVPLAGMPWDKIDPFLKKRFSKEMMQSHDFCVQEYNRKKEVRQKADIIRCSSVKLRD